MTMADKAPRLGCQGWRLATLASISVTLWVISITGSIVIFCAFPRFLPGAKRLLLQTETDEASRQISKPSSEEIMREQAILTLAAGEAIWALAAAGAISSLAMLTTLVWAILSRRVAMREMEARLAELSKQLEEIQNGRSPNPASVEQRGDAETREARTIPRSGLGGAASPTAAPSPKASLDQRYGTKTGHRSERASGSLAVSSGNI